MTLKLVMNADGAVDHKAGSVVSGGTFFIVPTESIKVKISGKGVHKGTVQFTLFGADAPGYDAGTVATVPPFQIISASAVKAKADTEAVMREGDFATVSLTGTISGTPTPFTAPFEISDAGQTKVKGD